MAEAEGQVGGNAPPWGSTAEEAESQIREAIEFHLEGMLADGEPIPEPSSTVEYVEVTA